MSRSASAQPNDPKAQAQELFEQGRAAVEAQDCARAIPLFRRSQAAYPSRGTLLNLAQCEADLGRVASAWQHFKELLTQLTPGDPRLAITQQRIRELEPRVPKLVIELAGGAPAPAELLLDQAPLPQASISSELPLDPGNHAVVARWPGGRQTDAPVTLAEGARSVVHLEPPPAAAPPPVPAPDAPQPPATSSGSAPAPAAPSSFKRTLGFVIGGVGAAAVGGSLITGGLALGTKGDLEKECPDPSPCSDDGMSLRSRGQTLTTTSTVLGAVGLVGIGAGLVLLLTAPEQRSSVALAPAILPGGGGGALLRSRF
ncbi:preprotein translocase subunit TatA [Sorangium sp. So ce448]|uniref:tetratricopeptide repeat protein n=1 Tax=Sorangium sp. So ce448 TaxID=3133314 RepID=UPI003F60C612